MLSEKYRKKIEKLKEQKVLTENEVNFHMLNDFKTLLNRLLEDGVIFYDKDKKIGIIKKDGIISIKFGSKLSIKFICDVYYEPSRSSFIVPIGIDEQEEFLHEFIMDNYSPLNSLRYVLEMIEEDKKKDLINELKKEGFNDIVDYILQNYPLNEKISGMLDDIIMKTCEKMTNRELVILMLEFDGKTRRKILRNVSNKRAQILLDEMNFLQNITKKEKIKARNKFYKILNEVKSLDSI